MTKPKNPKPIYLDGGRPTVMTDETIAKLETAFSLGCTDLEACIYADISAAALYNYQKRYPAFVERKNLLKEKVVLLARQNVVMAMRDGDDKVKLDTSKWYLERKHKDEFSTRVQNENRTVSDFDNMTDEELKDIIDGADRAKEVL